METNIMYIILAGWALMLFVPTLIPAFFMAAGIGGAAALMVFLGGNGELIRTVIVVSPIATLLVFVAWPVGVFFRWVLGSDPQY